MTVNKIEQLESHPCCDCSTIEGESELSTNRNIGLVQWYLGYCKFILYPPIHLLQTNHTAPLHWCHDARPCSGPALYMDRPALNHQYRGSTVTIKTPSRMQLQIAYIIFAQLVIISLLANVSLPKFMDQFSYQENIEQDWRLLPNLWQPLLNSCNGHSLWRKMQTFRERLWPPGNWWHYSRWIPDRYTWLGKYWTWPSGRIEGLNLWNKTITANSWGQQ